MIEIPFANDYSAQMERSGALRDGYAPCIVCGRAVNVNRKHWSVHVHHGGSHIVAEDEADRLNATGHANADLGHYPIGPDCLKKNPDIMDFAFRTEGY